jgi:hypothetical protein
VQNMVSLVIRHVLRTQSHDQQERGDRSVPLNDFTGPETQHACMEATQEGTRSEGDRSGRRTSWSPRTQTFR